MSLPSVQIHYHADCQLEAFHFQGVRHAFPPHFHRSYTLGAISQGSCDMRCGGDSCHLGPGWLFLLNPGDVHACGGNHSPLVYSGIRISPKAMRRWLPSTPPFMPRFMRPFLYAPQQASLLSRCAGQGLVPLSQTSLAALLHELFRRIGPHCKVAAPPFFPRPLCRVLELMGQWKPSSLPRQELARLAGLSASSMERLFSRYIGMPPCRYWLNARLEAAQQLLRQGLSPATVAQEVGMADQSHLCKAFSRHTGVRPGMYRRACQS